MNIVLNIIRGDFVAKAMPWPSRPLLLARAEETEEAAANSEVISATK